MRDKVPVVDLSMRPLNLGVIRRNTKISLVTALFLVVALLHAEASTALASDMDRQDGSSNVEVAPRQIAPDGTQLDPEIRATIFRNRQKLLEYLGDRAKRAVLCIPVLNESYDLSQASLHEELDVLWDLDIYASKYGLTKKQHGAVKACSSALEKYLDNFDLWQQLNRQRE
jgi:hypothetical protein